MECKRVKNKKEALPRIVWVKFLATNFTNFHELLIF